MMLCDVPALVLFDFQTDMIQPSSLLGLLVCVCVSVCAQSLHVPRLQLSWALLDLHLEVGPGEPSGKNDCEPFMMIWSLFCSLPCAQKSRGKFHMVVFDLPTR